MPYERKIKNMQQPQRHVQRRQQQPLLPMNPYATQLSQHGHSMASSALSDPYLVNLLQRLQLNISLQNGLSPLYDATLLNLLTPDAVQPSLASSLNSPLRFVPGTQQSYTPLNYLPHALDAAYGLLQANLCTSFQVGFGVGYNGQFELDFLPAMSWLLEQERQALLQLFQLSSQAASVESSNNNLHTTERHFGQRNHVFHPEGHSLSSGYSSVSSPCSLSSASIRLSPRKQPLSSMACCDISPPLYIQQQQKQQDFYSSSPLGVELSVKGHINKDETPSDTENCCEVSQQLNLIDECSDVKQYEDYIKIRNTRVKGYNRRVYFDGEDYVFDNDEMPLPGEKRTYLLLSDNTLNAEKHIKPALPGSMPVSVNLPKDTSIASSNPKEFMDGAGDNVLNSTTRSNELPMLSATPTLLIDVNKVESDSEQAMESDFEVCLGYDSPKEWPPLPQPQPLNFSSGFPDVIMKNSFEVKSSKSNVAEKQKLGGQQNERCIMSDLP